MLKILYISSIVPDRSCGAHIAMYRHLVARDDFEVQVCTLNVPQDEHGDFYYVDKGRLASRLMRTRLARWVTNRDYLLNWLRLPDGLLETARAYDPDVILAVPDNLHTGLAWQLARRLRRPLALNFQDLFPLMRFLPDSHRPFAPVRRWLMSRFRLVHERCDLAFYTSEGMSAWFGPHPNGHVLYPIGDAARPSLPQNGAGTPSKPVRIVYAGNCYGAYGRMLLRLAKRVMAGDDLELRIFPVGGDWSKEDTRAMREAGILRGFLPFEELRKEFEAADAFLTVMSFEEEEAPFVRTSFTTKWLDYAPYGKPIVSWAPSYSSSALFANRHDCALSVEVDDAEAVVDGVRALAKDEAQWRHYARRAREISETELDAESIHARFRAGIEDVVART